MSDFEEIIGYDFQDGMLLDEALTHPSASYKDGNSGILVNYERLEFLGDSVLGLVVAEYLLKKFPNEKEGEISKRHSGIVSGFSLAKIGRKINIGNHLVMAKGEELSGGRENDHNIEDAVEAVMGAIYLDGGYDEVKKFIQDNWADTLQEVKMPPKDPKTFLQERLQSVGKPVPVYQVVGTSGPAHSPIFEVKLTIDDIDVTAEGASKKKAEKQVAEMMIEKLGFNDE